LNPLPIISELRELGECTTVPAVDAIPELDTLELNRCYVSWDIFLSTKAGIQEVEDVFLFVPGEDSVSIRLLDEITTETPAEYRRLGQILVERGLVDAKTVEELVSTQRRLGELLIEQGVSAQEVESALKEQEHIRKTQRAAEAELATQSVRVKSERLDEMVNLVGELVTLQARLIDIVPATGSTELASVAETFERLVDELRDRTMEIRMVPISTVFTRLRRLIRDASRALEKQIEFKTNGGETELDKTVIERLSDPLIHMIRNCVDHGIESPEVRRERGKQSTGEIVLSAHHAGVNVEIEVRDDGGGLKRDRIFARAVERGIISEDVDLSPSEIGPLKSTN
jgi:two-component system chemotaxis sensor kinase CheA